MSKKEGASVMFVGSESLVRYNSQYSLLPVGLATV
jgi:hypothetical protein